VVGSRGMKPGLAKISALVLSEAPTSQISG